MKIVYLASVDVSEFNAPANHVKECACVMSKQHDVTLISARRRILQSHPLVDGVTHIPIAFPGINGGWRYFERRVSWILKRSGCGAGDVVYLRTSPSRIIARALSGMTCTKVMEVNGLEVSAHPNFKDMMDAADIVLVGTESTRKGLVEMFPFSGHKVLIHSNIGLDGAHFRPKDKIRARRFLGLREDAKLALHVSGFQPHHDYETLLRAAESISRDNPAFQLILVGDGERQGEIKASASGLIRSGAVQFSGAVAVEQLSNYIAAADVCINAMTMEKLGHGNGNAQKTMEYLACVRPVIETVDAAQDVPSWLSEHAMCVPPHNVPVMVDAIQCVMEQRILWEQKAASARDMLLRTHSWDAVVGNTLSMIERVRPARKQ